MNHQNLTVLMSVYNGERTLHKAIDSILSQTYNDFEFLIINDGSTDSSKEIILSYSDPRIRFVDNRENLGLPRSLNKALELAQGEYIARMDADDVSSPQRLEKQVKFLKNNQDIDIVAGWIERVDEGGKHFGFWRADRKNNTPEEIYYTLHFKNCIAHSSVLFKKKLILKAGGYNENFTKSQDYELWIRLKKIAKFAKIKEILVKWYDPRTNVSSIKNKERSLNEERLYLRNFSELLSDDNRKEILLFIKDPKRKKRPCNLSEILKVFNQMNNKIISEANPNILDIKKLKRYSRRRKNHFLFNLIKRSFFLTLQSKC